MIKEESFYLSSFFMLTFRAKGYIMNVRSKEIYKVKRGNDMTREKAIEILKYNSNVIHQTINGETDPKEVEALDMAVKALEQESVLDKMKDEIKEWYWQADKQALAKDPCVVDAIVDLFIRTINKYKAESEDK